MRRGTRDRLEAYVLVLPSVVLIAGIALLPIGAAIWLSLHRRILVFHIDQFVGLGNYRFLLRDPRFWTALGNTPYFVFVAVMLELLLGSGSRCCSTHASAGPGLLRASIAGALGDPHRRLGASSGRGSSTPSTGCITRPARARGQLAGTPGYAHARGHPRRRLEDHALRDAAPPGRAAADPRGRLRVRARGRRRLAPAHAHVDHPAAAAPGPRAGAGLPHARRFRVFDSIYVLTAGGPANTTETLSIYAYKTLMRGAISATARPSPW